MLFRSGAGALAGLSAYAGPVLVLYGEDDIFGAAEEIVRRRFPAATQVTLAASGHLHWLQNQAGYQKALRSFYATRIPATV